MAIDEAAAAAQHARLRWVGAPLLVSGAVILFVALTDSLRGGSGGAVLAAVGGTLSGLASFGVNHDTAMAFAMRAPAERLTAPLAEEVAGERERLRKGAPALRPNRAAGLLVPLISIGLQGFLTWRLLSG